MSTRHTTRLLVAALLIGCLAGGSRVYFTLRKNANASVLEQMTTMMTAELADQNVTNALKLLRAQINNTRSKLPDGLTNEFEQCIAVRLKEIQLDVSDNIVAEYKRAVMAKRILELSEHAMTLPFRRIPADSQQRKEAHQTYAAALERFEALMPANTPHLDERLRSLLSQALHPILTAVQNDLFKAGYGRPLSDHEKLKLNQILDRVLESAAGLSTRSAENWSHAEVFRGVAKLANDGRGALLDFLREREAGLRSNLGFLIAARKWHRENSALAKVVSDDMERATQAEWSAVMERDREQCEKDLRENDPVRIGVEAQAKEEMRNGLPLW